MKPVQVAQIHRDICRREKCPHLEALNFNDPCAACPEGHWGRYEIAGCEDKNRVVPDERTALGDKIAAIATPIARALKMPCIDPETKTLRPDSGCAKMKARLNDGMTIGEALKKRLKGE